MKEGGREEGGGRGGRGKGGGREEEMKGGRVLLHALVFPMFIAHAVKPGHYTVYLTLYRHRKQLKEAEKPVQSINA